MTRQYLALFSGMILRAEVLRRLKHQAFLRTEGRLVDSQDHKSTYTNVHNASVLICYQ